MKIKDIFLVLIFPVFCFGTCKNGEEPAKSLIIMNNSSEKIVPAFSYFPTDSMNICIQPTNKFEMAALEDATIPANSCRKQDEVAKVLINQQYDTVFIYIYYRIDIDKMSCEEFNRERPIRKRWAITKADADFLNWTLIYSPVENKH